MAGDGTTSRDELIRQAEKYLRQGRTDLAIELYERLVQVAPTDWNSIKQLADLLERGGHREAAAGRFLQCADHHFEEGFHAKAAALYRKVLKLEPHSEHAFCQLADVSLALKLKMDARQALGQVLALRERRGDTEGAAAVARRLADLEPDEARLRPGASLPSPPPPSPPPSPAQVTARLRQVARDAEARGDEDGALGAWLAVIEREPHDRALRGRLLRVCLDRRDAETARGLAEALHEATPEDVALRFEVAVLAGQADVAEALASRAARQDDASGEAVHRVRDVLRQQDPTLADTWCSRAVERLAQDGRAAAAATLIEVADGRHPLPVECHLRWVELCVDADLGGLDRAQHALATAYLRAGQPDLARAVADDLLHRRPDLEDVRALVLHIHQACGEPDPERSLRALLVPPDMDGEPRSSFAPVPDTSAVDGVPDSCHVAFASDPLPGDDARPLTAAPVPVLSAFASFDWDALLGRDPVAPASRLPAAPDVVVPQAGPVEMPAPHADPPLVYVASPVTAGVEGTIDLTALLDELHAAPEPSHPSPAAPDDGGEDALPGVLAARQVAAGRVFAAAGLSAEAARAFERAARDVRSRFEAAGALAELHRSRGQLVDAVRWYDEAAGAPVADAAIRRPVLYDLAETLEAVGQPDRALAVLLDLLSEVEDYRDARARADRLLRVDAGG